MSGTTTLHQHPAWFGAVMGTGAIAIVINLQSEVLEQQALEWIAIGMLWLSTILSCVLIPRYFRRLSGNHELRQEIIDPNSGAMLATLPAGVLVLAIGWGSIGPEPFPESVTVAIAAVLVGIGAAMTVAYSVAWVLGMSTSHMSLDRMHGGWLLPVVMSLLVPVGLSSLMDYWPQLTLALLTIGFAFLGIGTILFFGVFSMLIVRLATQTPSPNSLSPSLWIPLAPAGIFGVAAIRLTQSAEADGLVGPDFLWLAVAVAVMGIGFGLWWALFASMDVTRARSHGGVPFHLGWWSFVFPTAAMAISITLVGQVADFPPFLGVVASVCAVGVWILVSIKTVQSVISEASTHKATA